MDDWLYSLINICLLHNGILCEINDTKQDFYT